MKRLILITAVVLSASIAEASIITYTGTFSGANEIPANASAGTGTASVIVDTIANTIIFNVVFSGLSSGDIAAHIHCCPPFGSNGGVATAAPFLPAFPSGVTSGAFTNKSFSLLDPTFYLSSFVTNSGGTPAAAESALLAGLAAGQAYFNIHTDPFPGGEIRAQLLSSPEPGTFILSGLALLGVIAQRRIARRRA